MKIYTNQDYLMLLWKKHNQVTRFAKDEIRSLHVTKLFLVTV
jgi:hypothetical protein